MARKLPTITRAWLRRNGACSVGQDEFVKTFGASARVAPTRENLLAAAAAGMDIPWLSRRLLDEYADELATIVRIADSGHERAQARVESIEQRIQDGFGRLRGLTGSMSPRLPTAVIGRRTQEVVTLLAQLTTLSFKRDAMYVRAVAPAMRRAAARLADALDLP